MTEVSTVMPPGRRAITMAIVMAAMLIVIIDSTIANVALPHMQASLQATPDTISWVLTSYILASAVALPLTGALSERLGQRRLFTGAIIGFTLASMVCGVSTSLPMMIVARVVQGACGASLSPLSQSIMFQINPPERHVRAMTIWGLVIMIGPIAGPVLGGWITDNFSWRWVFYINVPIGVMTAIGSWLFIRDPESKKRPFDIAGFLMLAAALSAFQLMLDRGSQLDWFDSAEIWIEAGIVVGALWMFVIHTITDEHPLIPRAIFADPSYVTALITVTVLGGVLMAGAALVAPMLQRLFGYPVMTAGLLTVPRALGTMIGMLTAGRLAGRVDTRITIGMGMVLLATSLKMMTGFSLEMDGWPVISSGFVQGIGLGAAIMPMNMMAMATLPPALRTEGASLYNLMRSIGGSIAISITTALLARNVQVSHADLGAYVSSTSAPWLTSGLAEQLGISAEGAVRLIDLEINRQATMIAYNDDFWVMMWAAILVLPLLLFMRPSRVGQGGPPAVPDGH